jgi:hypothetical protein
MVFLNYWPTLLGFKGTDVRSPLSIYRAKNNFLKLSTFTLAGFDLTTHSSVALKLTLIVSVPQLSNAQSNRNDEICGRYYGNFPNDVW